MSVKNLEQIRTDYLRDLQNQQPAAHTHAGSDNHARGTALAALAEGQYQHQEWVLRQAFADTANSAYLEKHCAVYQIRRKSGTAAGGRVRISAKSGTLLPAGLTLRVDGRLYHTTQAVTVGSSGQAEVACRAVAAGADYNLPNNSAAQLQSAPAGAAAAATLLSMTGGTDTETDAALRDRLLSHLRRPPAGGNAYDYYRWAMEVPGVEQAFVYPLRRGLGTVDIAVLTAGGLPSPEVVAAAQKYIDERRPVTAKNALVLAPVRVTVAIAVRVSLVPGYTLEAVKANAAKALAAYFAKLKPGESVYKSHIEGIITDTAGVQDRLVTTPAANVTAAITPQIQWLALGSFEVSLL